MNYNEQRNPLDQIPLYFSFECGRGSMNITPKVGKAATRGQKQIFEENQSVIYHYSIVTVLSSVRVGKSFCIFYRKVLNIIFIRFPYASVPCATKK